MTRLPRCLLVSLVCATTPAIAQDPPGPVRARTLGVPFDGTAGPFNAITDVGGVLVGQTTLIRGEGAHAVRTGVTAIFPRAELGYYPAATYVLNGDTDFSGIPFAEEFGFLRSPIMLTGTTSSGTVFNAVVKWSVRKAPNWPVILPVIGETWDADLNDYLAFPLTEADVFAALDAARTGPVAEGNVGGGTGMVCHAFKCGIGTASRVLAPENGGFVVGVLVQANYGERRELRIAGVPVGREITDLLPAIVGAVADTSRSQPEKGSILVIVATDAPVGSLTLKAMAKRAALGLGLNGSIGNPFSGEVVLAFATTKVEWDRKSPYMVRGETMFPYAAEHLYAATIQATEEAVINALVAAQSMTGLYGSHV